MTAFADKEVWIVYSSLKTLEEKERAGETMRSFSKTNNRLVKPGDVIVEVLKEERRIIRVSIVSEKCRERSQLDANVYSGNDADYERYEIPLAWTARKDVPLEEVALVCGVPQPDADSSDNIFTIWRRGGLRAFYNERAKGRGAPKTQREADVILRFRTLVKTWLPT